MFICQTAKILPAASVARAGETCRDPQPAACRQKFGSHLTAAAPTAEGVNSQGYCEPQGSLTVPLAALSAYGAPTNRSPSPQTPSNMFNPDVVVNTVCLGSGTLLMQQFLSA